MLIKIRANVPEILFGALLAVAIFAMGYTIASSVYPPSNKVETSDHPKTANESAERAAEKEIARYTKWLAWFTAALVVVSAIQGYFLLRADKTARIAAEAAKRSADTLSRTERAQLFMIIDTDNITTAMRHYTVVNDDPQATDIATKLEVKFCFKNYGKTPAVIKEISRFIASAVELPDTIEYFPVDTVLSENVIATNRQTDVLSCVHSLRMKRAESNEIIRAQRSIWFYGRVLYDDALGSEHEHRFLWRYRSGPYGFRPEHHPEHSKST